MYMGVYRALVSHVTICLTCQMHVGLDVRGGLSSACGACDSGVAPRYHNAAPRSG